MRTSLFRFLLVAFCCTLLSACGSKLTADNLAKVTDKMTPQQVEEILGAPTKIDTQEIPMFATTRYVYQQGNDEVTIVFVNDKLISKSGSFGK